MTILKWILALAVGGFLILFGITKFTGGAHIFPLIEYKATAAGFPLADLFYPVGNYATGVLEVVAGLLVILPMTRKLGSFVAVAPLLGAVVFHLSPLLGIVTPNSYAGETPAGLLPLEEALAQGSGFVREHFSAETAPVLFIMAAVMFVVSVINIVVQRIES